LIIGLYTACLGFGSLIYDRYIKQKNISILLYTELSLAVIALISPLYILILFTSYMSFIPYPVLIFLSLIPVICIGLLSGIELPALMYASEVSSSKILFADFLGMFVSSIIFYNFILLNFSVFQILFFLALANALCCIFILKKEDLSREQKTNFFILTGVVVLLCSLALLFHSQYHQLAQRLFLK
jgi:predicted membrane-bound spermidine synthase